jgi:hypothetical protein
MTGKQLNTLKLFALGYPLHVIATKQRVSLSTIRSRLKAINTTSEFENACGIRNCYKQAKLNIKNPLHFDLYQKVLYKY